MTTTQKSSESDAENIVQLKAKSQTASRRYSSDEVADIIRLGLLNDAGEAEDTVDYKELVSIGKDLGVSAETIDRSILLLEQQQESKVQDRQLWQKFRVHCLIFISVSIASVLINFMAGLEEFWSAYIVIAMGLFVLGHYVGLRYSPESLQKALERTSELARSSASGYLVNDENVSFKIEDPSGFMESEGIIYLEEDKLQFEFKTFDSMLGLFRSQLKEVSVSLSEIKTIQLQQKFWSSELVIQGRNMKAFRHLPGVGAGKLVLKVKREAQQAALTLVLDVKQQLSLKP
jgi:hypothetical protein